MAQIRIVAFDPSLRNWGAAGGYYDLATQRISVDTLSVLSATVPTGKQVRQNSKDLSSAQQLYAAAVQAAQGAQAIFVEVPIGSQSARAMASYGICVGVLGGLRAQGIPFFEVTPNEVKLITGLGKQATKRQVIQWAYDQHSSAPWPFQTKKGVTTIIEGKAEHMADAVGALYAGIAGNEFQQLRSFLNVPHSSENRTLSHANHS
jgi:hypothetical protein